MDESEARASAREAIGRTPVSVLITTDERGFPAARQMGTLAVDDDFTVYYATATATAKCGQIERNPRVMVYWPICGQCQPGFGHVIVKGNATLTQDQELRDRFWDDSFVQYFPQGRADPTYVLIVVKPVSLHTYLCGAGEMVELQLA